VLATGLTVIVSPVPMDAPLPQPPLYQTQLAPVPNVPDVTARSELSPPHISEGVANADGATDGWLTLIVTFTHVVVSHAPSART
jgi:hypothetical protein